ncbi:MAG: hypothetical protein FWG32_02965 [Oscillospiraceae bacterium]|nr:hypothetical protein [Oscillospiraceae bacterium]
MYFEKAGKDNTDQTIEIALKAAKTRGIRHIVVASHTGATALKLIGQDGLNVVCVSGANGAREKGKNDMPPDTRQDLISRGIKVVTASHVLSGVERGISTKAGGMYPAEIMAFTLRMFGQGIKVCVEISVMALDADTIPLGEPVIAIGGTWTGADSAAVLTPSHASSVFETKIHEILCKPL